MFKSSRKDSAQAGTKAFSPLLDQCCCMRGDGSRLWVLCTQADISFTPALALRVCICFIPNSVCPSGVKKQSGKENVGRVEKKKEGRRMQEQVGAGRIEGLLPHCLPKLMFPYPSSPPLPPLPSHIHNFRKI